MLEFDMEAAVPRNLNKTWLTECAAFAVLTAVPRYLAMHVRLRPFPDAWPPFSVHCSTS
jgi:hypothetical protein